MTRLSAQNQMYLAIAVVVVLSLAFIFFGILPNLEEAATLDEQIVAEQANLATAQALVARRQSAKAQSATNEVELMRIANQVPDSPQLPSVIIELQDVANAARVELPQIAIGEIAPAKPAADGSVPAYDVLPVTITFEGEWSEIIDFCRRLKNLDRGVRMTSSSFAYIPAEGTDETVVQGSATIEVYMMAAAGSQIPVGAVAPVGQ
ncbi:MAG: type 4a pilus biogenesis protein PilO [Coriobacteriia bacterium]